MKTVAERKLFETTQYLITISRRLMGDYPFGVQEEIYFISEDLQDALKNINTKQSRFFAKELENHEFQKASSNKEYTAPQATPKSCQNKKVSYDFTDETYHDYE